MNDTTNAALERGSRLNDISNVLNELKEKASPDVIKSALNKFTISLISREGLEFVLNSFNIPIPADDGELKSKFLECVTAHDENLENLIGCSILHKFEDNNIGLVTFLATSLGAGNDLFAEALLRTDTLEERADVLLEIVMRRVFDYATGTSQHIESLVTKNIFGIVMFSAFMSAFSKHGKFPKMLSDDSLSVAMIDGIIAERRDRMRATADAAA